MINYRCTRFNYELNVVNITNIDERRYKSPPFYEGARGEDGFWTMVIDRLVDHS
jgi:hypothetical protein